MILKDSFRYSNLIQRYMNRAIGYLTSKDYLTTTTEKHNKKASNPEAEDETIIVPKDTGDDLNGTPNDMINFAMMLMDEKTRLVKAIDEAKKKYAADTGFNIDESLALNAFNQELASALNYVTRISGKESKKTAYDYKFNIDGNQVTYQYNVDSVTTIDFDRNKVKSYMQGINKKCDKVSTDIDKAQLTIEVDFEPTFDYTDSFEDAFNNFVTSKEKEDKWYQ